MKKIVYLISIFFVSFLCIRNVEAASASKTNYDSKCSYSFKTNSFTIPINIYFKANKDIFLQMNGKDENYAKKVYNYDNYVISPQYFNTINNDSSVDCPVLQACQYMETYELAPDTRGCSNGVKPINILPSGNREYANNYDGKKKKEGKSCSKEVTINGATMGYLKGEKVSIVLSSSGEKDKRKMTVTMGSGSTLYNTSSTPSVKLSYQNKQDLYVSFASNQADKIYDNLDNTGNCNFNAKMTGDSNAVNIILTTEAVEADESATGKTETPKKGPENQNLTDNSWSNEEGCTALKNGQTIVILRQILNYLQLAAVALLLVLGSLDFAGAIMSDKDDAMKQAGNKFVKRLIAAVIVFLVPVLVNIVLFIADKTESVCGLLS